MDSCYFVSINPTCTGYVHINCWKDENGVWVYSNPSNDRLLTSVPDDVEIRQSTVDPEDDLVTYVIVREGTNPKIGKQLY
jgi:hypothetical protein